MEFTDFFDYGSMNDDHQAAVSECAKWIKNTLKDEYTAERLLYQFKIKERKKFNVDDSQFYHMAKQFGLFCMVQGHLAQEDGVDMPFLAVNATAKDLDLFLQWATKERMDNMTQEEWKDYKLMENGARPEELTEEMSAKIQQEELEIQMMEEEGETRSKLFEGNINEFREKEKLDEELMQQDIERLNQSNEVI